MKAYFVFLLTWILSAGALASEASVDRLTQRSLDLDAHPENGAAEFQHFCSRCHGALAQGDAAHAIPALAAQRFKYVVRQLANFSGGERESATMQGALSHPLPKDPQTWVDMAAYLNNLPMNMPVSMGNGTLLARGRGIFREQCAPCHELDAHGDDEGFVPSLRGQQYSYLVNQLEKLTEGRRHNVDQDLLRFWRSLEERDVLATADYLSRLAGPGHVHKIMRTDGSVVD